MKAEWLPVVALLAASGAVAAPAALDPEFLAYLERYGDARGEVFDARDLAEAVAHETAPPPPATAAPRKATPSTNAAPEKMP